ncbi:MAG: UDP-N-acetylmuramoyl-L-alanine--D-glutamate ligase [Mariprofundaceae bacterium]
MNIKRQNIAIMGMGQTGQSLARFLLRKGDICEGFDEHKITLPDSLDLPLHIGRFNSNSLSGFDLLAVSPGIRWSHPALVALREKGMPLTGDLDIFLDHYTGPVIAITGTNGKTTTTYLIEIMLETLPGGIEAGGNVGTPMLDLIQNEREPSRVVLELSSFQLERSNNIKPDWAVLLNFQADHADMHSDKETYLAAKLKIFEKQGEGDKAILPADSQWDTLVHQLQKRGAQTLRFGRCSENDSGSDALTAGIMDTSNGPVLFWYQYEQRQLIPCEQIPARGTHQHMNMAIAAQAAADYGVHPEIIRETMICFRGLKHRLEHICMTAGKDWYDDSKATNPDAAIAALNSFEKAIWICGGLRKNLDLGALIPVAHEHVSHAFVIGKETRAYTEMLEKAKVPYKVAGNIQRAVSMASKQHGDDPVLLSPAAASQDQFANYAERGATFAKAALELGGAT